jgi:3-dehydroquinate synthase
VAGYGEYLHGEAVAIGMVAETKLAESLGWMDSRLTQRLIQLLTRLQLPTTMKSCNIELLMGAMKHDKKNKSGRVRFVIPRRLGKVTLTDEPIDEQIIAVLKSLSNPEN